MRAANAWSDAAFDALAPRPRLTVSGWADTHRVIPRSTSSEAGPWRTSRAPYLREIMDAVGDPDVERIAMMAASQVGKSEFLLNVIGYFADQDPSAILFVQPTEIAMAAFSKERIEGMFSASPRLRGKLSESLRDKGNTILLKQFPGGYLACAWATSSVSLASRPIRILLGDELDRWPETTGRDGDPWAQAVQRTSNFHNRKIIAVSTPTIEGLSPIARLYEDTDQRRLWMPCPRCGAYQVLQWPGVIYKRDGVVDLDDVHYRCEHCEGRIEERDRPEMLDACEWRPDNPGHRHRGYQLSALVSPWVKWRELAEQWAKANADRDKRGLREFKNLRLGETWTEGGGDEVTAEGLESNREEYEAEVPGGVLLLTAGVDVQDNRLEVEIVGWGIGRESWGIHYGVIPGDTTDTTSPRNPWAQLDALLARSWKRADGSEIVLWCTCIDSGGHRTSEVYAFCRARLARNIFAVKGRAGAGHPIAGKPTPGDYVRPSLYHVGVDTAKDALFSRLALPTHGPGYCHFPSEPTTGYDTSYFQGLCSERRKVRIRAGRRVLVWVQSRPRNEPLDCRNYATAAMEILQPNFEQLAEAAANGPAPAAAQKQRRVVNPGVTL